MTDTERVIVWLVRWVLTPAVLATVGVLAAATFGGATANKWLAFLYFLLASLWVAFLVYLRGKLWTPPT